MKSKLKITDVSKPGGVISDVVEGHLEHKGKIHKVVVKRTHKKVKGTHFSHSDRELQKAAPRTHILDRQILERLQNYPSVAVPHLHISHSKGRQTVMSDFTANGYILMQDLLVQGKLPSASATNIGRALAELQVALDDKMLMKGIKPVENSVNQIRERLAEAHILLYGNLEVYRHLESKLLEGEGLLYTDGHPKNIAVNENGEVILFDFGRIIKGSSQYPAPNFLAHIGLAWIGGTMPPKKAETYIRDCYVAYENIMPIEEEWFVQFFAAELVHRGLAMRWIDPRLIKAERKRSAKLISHAVFLDVFEGGCDTLDKLIGSIRTQAISNFSK